MLNAADLPAADDPLTVIDYGDAIVAKTMASGHMNTEEDVLAANIQSSIRRGYPQIRTGPTRPDRVCLVGSGPSLTDTFEELRDLVWSGAHLVTLNGAYQWCLERTLRPNTQIVMDARPSNARFVQPAVPHCRYVLASQCAPAVWDAVEGRSDVWIWHPVIKSESQLSAILDEYYAGKWVGIGGGTTVATRAINLLRIAGYLRFDLFGVDCCWTAGAHHAMPQPENAHEKPSQITITVAGRDPRTFTVSPWHLKQFEDLIVCMKVNGALYQLEVHGDGMFAHALRVLGSESLDQLQMTKE